MFEIAWPLLAASLTMATVSISSSLISRAVLVVAPSSLSSCSDAHPRRRTPAR
ncbi:MAG: hypothetical protein GX938_05540 [Spirochaetales bacterium]|nr:hypothetical protein [Spirochaetales bacterium]